MILIQIKYLFDWSCQIKSLGIRLMGKLLQRSCRILKRGNFLLDDRRFYEYNSKELSDFQSDLITKSENFWDSEAFSFSAIPAQELFGWIYIREILRPDICMKNVGLEAWAVIERLWAIWCRSLMLFWVFILNINWKIEFVDWMDRVAAF